MPRTAYPFAAVLAIAVPTLAVAGDPASTFPAKAGPVLAAHCTGCHGGTKPKAGLDLSSPPAVEKLRTDSAVWFRVLDQVESGAMPPKGKDPLTAAEKKSLADWVRTDLAGGIAELQQKEGRSKFRRLTKTEYANTILDLFGFRPAVGRDLPSDGRVDGYDKVAAALPLSAAGAAGYSRIAEDVLSRMLLPLPKKQDRTVKLWGGPSEQSKGHILELPDGTMVSFNTDTTSGPLRQKSPDGKLTGGWGARVPGTHKLRLSVYGYQTDKPLPFGIYAGHTGAYPQMIELVKVLEAQPGKPTILETEIYLRTRLDNDIAPISDSFRLIPFGLGVPVPKNTQAKNCKGPGLAVQWVEIEEPELPLAGDKLLGADFSPAMLEKIRSNRPQKKFPPAERDEFLASVRKTFHRVGARFYRRDLTAKELETAVANVRRRLDDGATLRAAFLEEVATFLTSPDFLCVIEKPGKLDGFALASRLSYLLWNSTPDEPLLDLARKGKLSDAKILREQTDRLLADPKSERFVADFTDQWLGLRGIDDTTPDRDLYPGYDELLKVSSLTETRASFRKILDKNLSVRDFVAPKWAIVNERLAKHYGLPDVAGNEFREIPLPPDSPYGGIWTHASTMKVTANGTLTSPVKRGVWVAERLLGMPIPPPPANIEPVTPDTRGAKTLREQLALHRGSGSCAACHAKFDPYGFALESFDVTGRFRTHYRIADPDVAKLPPNQRKGKPRWKDGLPVDPTGETPDGRAFSGVGELRKFLADNPEPLARGVTRHLLTYATGAPSSYADQTTIDAVVKLTAGDGYGLRSLIHSLVQCDTFRSK